jgi:hypothetical protein
MAVIYTVLRPDGYSGPAYGNFSGKPIFIATTPVVNTTILTLPINCVMGDGTPELQTKKAMALEGVSGITAKIFGE